MTQLGKRAERQPPGPPLCPAQGMVTSAISAQLKHEIIVSYLKMFMDKLDVG